MTKLSRWTTALAAVLTYGACSHFQIREGLPVQTLHVIADIGLTAGAGYFTYEISRAYNDWSDKTCAHDDIGKRCYDNIVFKENSIEEDDEAELVRSMYALGLVTGLVATGYAIYSMWVGAEHAFDRASTDVQRQAHSLADSYHNTGGAPPVRWFENCYAMRQAGWSHGVGEHGGSYKPEWNEAEARMYHMNSHRDRDDDGHACEPFNFVRAFADPSASRAPRRLYFHNCAEARRAGYHDIRRGSPGYDRHLDRDNDGIACERSFADPSTSRAFGHPHSRVPHRLYFRNCAEARRAGYSDIRRGSPGYSRHLDRDNDGIACER